MLRKAFLALSVLFLMLSGCSGSAFVSSTSAPVPVPASAPAQNASSPWFGTLDADTDCSMKFTYVKGQPHTVGSYPDGHSFGNLPGPSPVRQSQITPYRVLQPDRPAISVGRGSPYQGHY
ncbi:uncharacterized protein LOC109716782 isoform X1 [Ananas comosus]|uniref:Uncharacterized protein LOC109716782 isoform X1 n=1 Tax=Ananas comosus TaxID=4615 RepID=A0A6P5FNR1_ANACO|nr:uncharacterized protein LOC109716782 isoform X1 [Ananas comosus]